MLNKFEAFGIAGSIALMVVALWLLRVEDTTDSLALLDSGDQAAAVLIADSGNARTDVGEALIAATNESGTLEKMIIDDIKIGTGNAVAEGDSVTVHYIGSLQNGQQFDNSYEKGAPFIFTVGAGRVIKGWDQGLVGMQVGGQRVLVIPSDLGYGPKGYGPIPPAATLVFAIELVSINE